MEERRWYAEWKVWLCLVVLAVAGIAGWILGLPFRLLNWIF